MRDFLKDNLVLLSNKSPELYSLIKKTKNDERYKVSKSKSGVSTISKVFPDGKNKTLQSKYNPLQEATQFVDSNYSNDTSNYILIGLGLGYHLLNLHKRITSQDRIIIFEKNPALFKLALSQNDFSDVLSNPAVSFHIDIDPNNIEQILYEDRTNLAIHSYTLISLKSLVELDKDYYQLLITELQQTHQKYKLDIDTQSAYSKKFYKNILANAKSVIESPGISQLRNAFSKVPVILVSAGPSLDKNIGFIKSARNQVLVISVATALKPLLKNNIEPDFVIAIDPNDETIESFNVELIPETLWLVYDPCIPFSVISLFNKRKIVMESNIELAKWITGHNEQKGFIENTSSVAHAAFHLARYMNCEPIILVGQDLSFEGHRMHCTDSFYSQANQDNIGTDRTIDILEYKKYAEYNPSMSSTKDIFEQKSKTTKAMETYKHQFKKEIKNNNITVNATEGGVNIPGAINISLKEALNKYCKDNKFISASNILKTIKKSKKNKSFVDSIKNQLERFNAIKISLKVINNKYLSGKELSKKRPQFILEMESFYSDLLKDEITMALLQGYDYIAFVEWSQETKKITKLSENESAERKFQRDNIFIKKLAKTIDYLSNSLKKMKHELS
jgi:hypothetical protein